MWYETKYIKHTSAVSYARDGREGVEKKRSCGALNLGIYMQLKSPEMNYYENNLTEMQT